jgi:hypothetical protein
MATTIPHRVPTLQHAIADLTGYEDADTLRWQQACVHAAQQLTGEQGRYAGTDTDRLAQGLDLAQRGCVTRAEELDDLRAEVTSGTAHSTVDLAQRGCPCLDFQQRNVACLHLLAAEIHTGALGLDGGVPRGAEPLVPPDTTPRVPNTSLQEGPTSAGPGATASSPERATRKRAGRAHRGQVPAPTGSAARWPTSEAPASMNVKLKVGNMELMYTARDTNDRDIQDRMTTLLPWLAEVMAACEATYDACRQAAKQAAEQPTPPPPPAPTVRILHEQMDAAVQAAMPAQTAASPNGAGPAAEGRRTPPPPPASERTNDMDPSWCPIHQCQMQRRSNARGSWYSHRLHSGAYCKGE